jgi:hypothetical protein
MYRFARERQELFKQTQDSLRKASKHMVKCANKKQRPLEFEKEKDCWEKSALYVSAKV